MDKIMINDIRVDGRHGYSHGEQNRLQPFRIDVVVMGDYSKAGRTDDLKMTFDYRNIISMVRTVIEGKSVYLLETLAERIAAEILQVEFVEKVQVRVTKLTPPIEHFDGTVAVEIEREH